MKGHLIYSCQHCGELHYDPEVKELTLDHDGATVRISEDGESVRVPTSVWHKCFGKSKLALPNVHMGRCALVGVAEFIDPDKEEAPNG
jgi:hypothetical protein